MNMEHQLREVCRDRSSSSEGSSLRIIGKHKDHLTAFFFFFLLFSPVPRSACMWVPKCWPRGFKNAKPILSRLLNFRDLWQRGETFCRGSGALPGWPRQVSPLLSRTEEWWEGSWVDVSRQPSGGGQIFSHATWGGDPGLLPSLRHAS